MTKQGEIYLGLLLNRYRLSKLYREHHLNFWDIPKEDRQIFYDEVDKDFAFLHSQGVVMQKDRVSTYNELWDTKAEAEFEAYNAGRNDMLREFCYSIEPLIEEKE